MPNEPLPLDAENWRIIQNPTETRWLLQYKTEWSEWKTWKILLTHHHAEKELKLILHYS
jgi:hypothetical protein